MLEGSYEGMRALHHALMIVQGQQSDCWRLEIAPGGVSLFKGKEFVVTGYSDCFSKLQELIGVKRPDSLLVSIPLDTVEYYARDTESPPNVGCFLRAACQEAIKPYVSSK